MNVILLNLNERNIGISKPLTSLPLLVNPDWNQVIGDRDERLGEGRGEGMFT